MNVKHTLIAPFAAMLLFLLAAPATGQAAPLNSQISFFILPDGNLAPGSESRLEGTATPNGAPTPFAFDFTEDQRIDRNGHASLRRSPSNVAAFDVLDFRFRGLDPASGVTITFDPAPGPYGLWTTSDPIGLFPAGATIAASLPCVVTVDDPSWANSFPASGTLLLTGVLFPGYFKQAVLLTASMAGLPATVFEILMKEDLHEPAITWPMTADNAASSAVDGGSPSAVPLTGYAGLRRHASAWNAYDLVDLSFDIPGSPGHVTGSGGGGFAGTVYLDATTGGVSGTLLLNVGGTPVVRALDGVGDTFTGSHTMPTSLTLTESGLGGLTQLTFVGGRTAVLKKTNDFENGLTTELLLRGRPGSIFLVGASLNPVPGVDVGIGDVFVSLDALLFFSLDPANGIIFGNAGQFGPSGEATAYVVLPSDPGLVGYTSFFAGLTFEIDPLLGLIPTATTNCHRAVIK